MSFLDDPLLLVPMHVDALAVGTSLPDSEMFQWTNLSPNFSKLQSDYFFGAKLIGDHTGDPFERANGLKTGIHLLFELPRAFSRGRQGDNDSLSFPAIPNRWLVQRFGGTPATHKAWLIKSDAAASDSVGVSWAVFPQDEETPVQLNRIGAYTEVSAAIATEDEEANVRLTAVGQGNPLFSSYYPACRNVLGFHDPMTGVAGGARLSYLVTGWFSTAKDDPLNNAPWKEAKVSPDVERSFRAWQKIPAGPLTDEQQLKLQFYTWLNDRQWTCEFDTVFQPPSRLLCHGLVRGVTWQTESANYLQTETGASISGPQVFPADTDNLDTAYRVAVGNTGAEALAALLANGNVDQDLLTALQDGLLAQPVTAAELQYELHDRRFEGSQGGTTFVIQPTPDHAQTNINDYVKSSAIGQSGVVPAALRDLLLQLNAKQNEYDRLAREVEDCRWQVYALWYLWTTEVKNNPNGSPRTADLASQLETFKTVLTKTKADLDAAKNERDALCSAKAAPEASTGKIIDELAKYPKTQPDGSPQLDALGEPELKYRVVSSVAPPFYEPSEPVIAVSGPAMAKVNTVESVGPPVCRFTEQMVTGVLLQIPGSGNVTISSETLIAKLFADQSTIQFLDVTHRSLLGEALMLDDAQAGAIAAQASSQFTAQLTQIVQALQDPDSTAAQEKPAPSPNALVGRLPARLANFNWQGDPWRPLVMVWEVSWQPDYQVAAGQLLPEELVTARWQLDAMSGDLVPNSNAASGGAATTYQGYSILSASGSSNLAERLEALDESQPLINVIKNKRVQLQRLAGFNDALVLQQTAMQIPPLDYNRWFNSSADIPPYNIDPIIQSLNDGFSMAEKRYTFRTVPDTDGHPFLPIRSGQMQITRVSIVDAFGQTLKLPVTQINDSTATNDSMLRAANSCVLGNQSPANPITLRPRSAQPLRLQFEWANASVDSDPGTGPVCGWILPNYLEKSLAVYAADGKPVGALQRKLGQKSGTADKGAFYWVDVPAPQNGNGAIVDQDIEQRLTTLIENVHLRNLCLWILGLSPDMGEEFSSLVSDVIASADQRVPEEDPGISVLIGRPLALVRADFKLEISGLPPRRPELRSDTGTNIDDLIDTNGFERVKWPLRVGDLAARNDGLVGAFRCATSKTGVDPIPGGPLYPAWGQDKDVIDNTVKVFAAQDFVIDCVEPLQLTMLIDPQARVHATTGVLPRAYAALPPETLTAAKRAREVFFQTAPVLGFSPTPGMPRPSDDYGEWSWAFRPDVTQWKLDPKLIEATYLGGFNGAWPTIAEGWLKLVIPTVKVLSFWLREPAEKVDSGSSVHLAWSLLGAESLELFKVKDDKTLELIKQWDAPPFPNEYGVTVDTTTTYRLVASAKDAKPDSRDLTIEVKASS